MGVFAMLPSLVRDIRYLDWQFFRLPIFFVSIFMVFFMPDDGKLQAESDSGEFWVLFGGFAPIGKKTVSDDDVVLETTAPKLYRYFL
jgi:hypothetical protein